MQERQKSSNFSVFLSVLKFYVFWDGDVSRELRKTVIELHVQETVCLMGASVIGWFIFLNVV